MDAMKNGLGGLADCLSPAWAPALTQAGDITVTGRGEVAASPDMATIRLGVTEQADDARAAMQATSEAVAEILDRLTGLGIAPNDVQTRRLTVSPVWSGYNDRKDRKITGYVASNTISARVRDLTELGDVLDQLLAAGANDFDGLQFSMQDPDPLIDEARKAAVADAMDKAALYAQAAGVTLGTVQSISEQGSSPRPVMREMASMARDASVPIAEGEVTMQAAITMVFSIADE